MLETIIMLAVVLVFIGLLLALPIGLSHLSQLRTPTERSVVDEVKRALDHGYTFNQVLTWAKTQCAATPDLGPALCGLFGRPPETLEGRDILTEMILAGMEPKGHRE